MSGGRDAGLVLSALNRSRARLGLPIIGENTQFADEELDSFQRKQALLQLTETLASLPEDVLEELDIEGILRGPLDEGNGGDMQRSSHSSAPQVSAVSSAARPGNPITSSGHTPLTPTKIANAMLKTHRATGALGSEKLVEDLSAAVDVTEDCVVQVSSIEPNENASSFTILGSPTAARDPADIVEDLAQRVARRDPDFKQAGITAIVPLVQGQDHDNRHKPAPLATMSHTSQHAAPSTLKNHIPRISPQPLSSTVAPTRHHSVQSGGSADGLVEVEGERIAVKVKSKQEKGVLGSWVYSCNPAPGALDPNRQKRSHIGNTSKIDSSIWVASIVQRVGTQAETGRPRDRFGHLQTVKVVYEDGRVYTTRPDIPLASAVQAVRQHTLLISIRVTVEDCWRPPNDGGVLPLDDDSDNEFDSEDEEEYNTVQMPVPPSARVGGGAEIEFFVQTEYHADGLIATLGPSKEPQQHTSVVNPMWNQSLTTACVVALQNPKYYSVNDLEGGDEKLRSWAMVAARRNRQRFLDFLLRIENDNGLGLVYDNYWG